MLPALPSSAASDAATLNTARSGQPVREIPALESREAATTEPVRLRAGRFLVTSGPLSQADEGNRSELRKSGRA